MAICRSALVVPMSEGPLAEISAAYLDGRIGDFMDD
jgi:hypothetical protein